MGQKDLKLKLLADVLGMVDMGIWSKCMFLRKQKFKAKSLIGVE